MSLGTTHANWQGGIQATALALLWMVWRLQNRTITKGEMSYSDPIRIVKGFRRKSFSQSPFTIQAFTNQIGLL
jgi:hypothetical protein